MPVSCECCVLSGRGLCDRGKSKYCEIYPSEYHIIQHKFRIDYSGNEP